MLQRTHRDQLAQYENSFICPASLPSLSSAHPISRGLPPQEQWLGAADAYHPKSAGISIPFALMALSTLSAQASLPDNTDITMILSVVLLVVLV